MFIKQSLTASGSLTLQPLRRSAGGSWSAVPARELSLREIVRYGLPFGAVGAVAAWRLRNLPNLLRGVWRVCAARLLKLPHFYGQVSLTILRRDGQIIPLGLASLRVVTTAGVNAIVDAFQNTVEVENFKFHGIGTGSTAEAAGDTALVTEITTAYNPDNTRATGSTTEGASANIYRTVGTVTVDASVAAVEHGIFSQAATGGGTLLDRTVFSVVNLASGDSLQVTYDLTFFRRLMVAMACKAYDIGDSVRLTGTFQRKSDNVFVDPTTVKLRIRNPRGVNTIYVYGVDAVLMRESVGQYSFVLAADKAGRWTYRFEGAGMTGAAEEKEFKVSESAFYYADGTLHA